MTSGAHGLKGLSVDLLPSCREITAGLSERFQHCDEIVLVTLFGSVAKGRARAQSDIDLLIFFARIKLVDAARVFESGSVELSRR